MNDKMTTADKIIAFDMAATSIIALIFKLAEAAGDKSIEDLKAQANAGDIVRAEIMAKIKDH